jgi:hypothetical protein
VLSQPASEAATMNHKNLINIMLTVAATAALYGCASAPAPQQSRDIPQAATSDELVLTRNAWASCLQTAIPRLDVAQSPTDAVAHAAMQACTAEYTRLTQTQVNALAPACSRDAQCARNATAKAQREATQSAIDAVVTARVRVAGAQAIKCQ